MKKIFLILSFVCFFSQGQNIAYVDSRYILQNIPEFNAAQDELNITLDETITELQEELAKVAEGD